MKSIDIRETLFGLSDSLLSANVPLYQHQLEEFGVHLDYQYIDSTLSKHMQISMEDRCVWIIEPDDVVAYAVEDGLITERERENYLMMSRLGLSNV